MNGDEEQPDEGGNWQYKPSDPDVDTAAAVSSEATAVPEDTPDQMQQSDPLPIPEQHPEVSWTAAEFVHHEKSLLWYLGLIVITVGLASAIYLISHDRVSTTLIVIIGLIFGATAGRKPRSLQYLLDSKGVTVNRAFRPYSDFKSFALVHEPEVDSIIFLPMQRFTLPLSLYVSAEGTDEVVTKLTDYLPNDQTHGHDALDSFLLRIHF